MGYYDTEHPMCTVDVLGTEYKVYLDVSDTEDSMLKECDGYCDKTSKRIAICDCIGTNLDCVEDYKKYCLRHELVHAFMFESGIGGCVTWDIEGQEHPEHMVEWIAMQFPKMVKAFQTAGAL